MLCVSVVPEYVTSYNVCYSCENSWNILKNLKVDFERDAELL